MPSFPSSPTQGQTATKGNRTYSWSGKAWEFVGSSGSGGGGSGEDTALRALFLPPAPTSLAATTGNAQVSLSWTAPSATYIPPITDYVVQYSSNSGSTWTTFSDGTSTSTSATVTGLTNGTAYVFRVAAVNGVGTGAFTAASASVTPAAPPPVITISEQPSNQTASSGAATFSVTASVTQSATLSYQWQKSTNSGSTWTAVSGATSSSLALTGLVSGDNASQYRVVVSATDGATSVTSSSATLTVASGPAFSAVSWDYNPYSASTFSVSGNTITATTTSTPRIQFTIPNATLTATRTSSATGWYGHLFSDNNFPGGNLEKDGSYSLWVVYNATSGSVVNLPAGNYRFGFSRGDNNTEATFTLVLS